MTNLQQNTLLREIPDNLLVDKKVVNLAKTLQVPLDDMLNWAFKINYTLDLNRLDDAVLDYLLWEKNVGWSEGLALATTKQQKINLIESSIELHRTKGTPFAIERVLRALNLKGEVLEWWEYLADPFHFIVELEIPERKINIDDVRNLVIEYKNARSWFDGFVMVLGSVDIVIIDDSYHYQVFYPITGEFSGAKEISLSDVGRIDLKNDTYNYRVEYPMNEKLVSTITGSSLNADNDTYNYIKKFPIASEMATLSKRSDIQVSETKVRNENYNFGIDYAICGEFYAESE